MSERRRRDLLPPLLAALAVILLFAFLVFRPFLLAFAVAASVALLLAPLQRRLTKALGQRATLAAALLVLVTTVAILVPLVSSLAILGNQARSFFGWLKPRLQPQELERLFRQTLPEQFPWLGEWVEHGQAQLMPFVSGALSQLASAANGLVQGLVAGLTSAVLELLLFLLVLFFLLRDGSRLMAELREVSPFSPAQESLMLDHIARTVKGVLQAMLVVPLIQGFLATIGFWLFGVPAPVAWGVAVMLAAMVPLLGAPLGWVPACVYLLLTAGTWPAVGMLVYGTVVISGIDNVVKPLVLRESAQIHPLLGFLSILGGVLAFGVSGFLVGPVILSLVLSALRIYRLDVLRAPAPSEADRAILD